MAHGHDITNTEMAIVRQNCTSRPMANHAAKHAAAMTITVGTNTDATLSAIFATGAFVPCAISIILAIWNSTVSSPVFSTLARMLPDPFTVPP